MCMDAIKSSSCFKTAAVWNTPPVRETLIQANEILSLGFGFGIGFSLNGNMVFVSLLSSYMLCSIRTIIRLESIR